MRASDLIARAHDVLLAPDKTFLMDSVSYWPSLRQLEFYRGAQLLLWSGGRRDGRKTAQLALARLNLEVLMAKTKRLNRWSGKDAAKAEQHARAYEASEQTIDRMARNGCDLSAKPAYYSLGTPAVEKLTRRQQQTRDAFVAFQSIARSTEQLACSKDTLAPEAVISKAVAQIPARLLRGVLVQMTRDTLHNEARVLFVQRQNERLADEQRTEDQRHAELRDKFATLLDAVKLITKIADAL
jgi:hypothetical protein